MPKVTHIEVMAERNYRTNPTDKYQVGKMSLATRVELEEGDLPRDVAFKAMESCKTILGDLIQADQVKLGFKPQ